VVRDQGGATRTIGRVPPAWFGWGRYLRVTAVGPTIQCEVAAPSGAGVRVAGKLDLYGPSRESEIRVEDVPFRVVVAPVAAEPLARGRAPALAAAVHRGKLLVAEGQARDGAALEADGLRVSFPAWVPWAQLELVRDPGLPLAALGAVAALAALAGQVASRLRRRAAPAGPRDAP
jgi:hypothetical protein